MASVRREKHNQVILLATLWPGLAGKPQEATSIK